MNNQIVKLANETFNHFQNGLTTVSIRSSSKSFPLFAEKHTSVESIIESIEKRAAILKIKRFNTFEVSTPELPQQ
jgi:hypothetical protein